MRLLFIASSLVALTTWNVSQCASAEPFPSASTLPAQDSTAASKSGSVVVPTLPIDGDFPSAATKTENGKPMRSPSEPIVTPSSNAGYVIVPTLPLNAAPTAEVTRKDQPPVASPSQMQSGPAPLAVDSIPTNPGTAPQVVPETPQAIDASEDGLGDIQEIPRSQKQRSPDVQVLLRTSGVANVNSAGLAGSATLLITPQLGPDTRLVAFAGGGILLYNQFGGSDFSYFSYGIGVQQKLTENMYAQLGVGQERLYKTASGEFVIDNAARFAINRQDKLTERLRLDSFYELRAGFADQNTPYDQSRVSNSLGVGLSYAITPKLEAGLDVRLVADSFTRGTADTFGRVQTSLSATYHFSQQAFITGSVSYLYGSTFDPFDGPNSLNTVLFGITAGFNLY